MNINTSYTQVNGFTDVQASSLEKIASSLAINQASDDASGLAIASQLGVQKSTLSQGLENMNSGIAMSNIAQSGISSQKEILEEIKTETLKAMNGTVNEEGREAIKNKIDNLLDQYDNIAQKTNYNGEKLLETKGDATDDISIAGDESIINMEKADTSSISTTLRGYMSDFTTNPDSMRNMVNDINTGLDKLSSFAGNFGSASNAFESMARNYMSAEKEMASAQSTILDIDYGKEVSDFSKNNLLTQIGYLMQTQANAIQAKNVSLLS